MAALARHFLRHLPPPTPFSERWACETMRPETVVWGSRLRARDFLESAHRRSGTAPQDKHSVVDTACADVGLGRRGFALESAAGGVCREAGNCLSVNQHIHDKDIAVPNVADNSRLEVVADGFSG